MKSINMNLVYGVALHEFSIAQVDRAPAHCLGGHRFESFRGLRFFLCPTLVTCWLFHFLIIIIIIIIIIIKNNNKSRKQSETVISGTIDRLRFTFTPNGKREFVPRDQVSSLTAVYCLLLPPKIKWSHASFIHKNCCGQFFSSHFYFDKFSTWIWRLPFAVNVTLNLSNNRDGSDRISPTTRFEFALPKLYSAILILCNQSIFVWSPQGCSLLPFPSEL